MTLPALLALDLVVTMAVMVGLWGLSTRLGDPSFVDAALDGPRD